MDIHERHGSQETDQEDVDESQSTSTKKQNSKQSPMSRFLSSIGRKSTSSSSTNRSTTKSKLNEELMTYRSLAQKEFNSIINDEKENDVVSVIRYKVTLFLHGFFQYYR